MSNRGSHLMMVCEKMLIEQRKTLLLVTGGFLGMCALLGLWTGFMGATVNSGGLAFYIMTCGLVCAFVASKMFYDMTTKERRISLLMLPATPAEKFLPRLITVVPGMILLVVMGYLVLGYTNILIMGIKYDIWSSLYNPFMGMDNSEWQVCIGLMSLFLLNESVFVFGSIAWPRKSFIKTICIFVAIQIVLSVLLSIIIKAMVDNGLHKAVGSGDAIVWTGIIVTTCIAIAIFYASFVKFKRSKVI